MNVNELGGFELNKRGGNGLRTPTRLSVLPRNYYPDHIEAVE